MTTPLHVLGMPGSILSYEVQTSISQQSFFCALLHIWLEVMLDKQPKLMFYYKYYGHKMLTQVYCLWRHLGMEFRQITLCASTITDSQVKNSSIKGPY